MIDFVTLFHGISSYNMSPFIEGKIYITNIYPLFIGGIVINKVGDFFNVPLREQTGLILTRIDEIFKGYLTFPTPVISLTPILLSNAGGTGGGDLCKTPQNPVRSPSSELWRFLLCGDDERFNFCAALK